MGTSSAKPFLKWAGGKTQLLDEVRKRIPVQVEEGEVPVFVEPFVGGGAVYFFLNGMFDFKTCHIFDINEELVLAYTVVRDDVESLIHELDAIAKEYVPRNEAARKDYYYQVRETFNQTKQEIDFSRFRKAWTERAAQLIFLNKTCFNGLFRVNAQGEFNVPFGSYKKPAILNATILRADSALLKNTEIHQGDFTTAGPYISGDSFVYFDPPYRPLNPTSSFTGYAKDGFSDDEQRRLARFFTECHATGSKLMLSNSDPRNSNPEDQFFDSLYADYRIERVPAKRYINRDGTKRGAIHEIIVTNY